MKERKRKSICDIHDAPEFLIDNEHIKKGYRVNFNTFKCLVKSLFQWHNETINVWTHLLGSLFVITLVLYTVYEIKSHREEVFNSISKFKHETTSTLSSLYDSVKETSSDYYDLLEGNFNYYKEYLNDLKCAECLKEIIDHIEYMKNHIVDNINENITKYKKILIDKLDSEGLAFIDLYHKHKDGEHIFIVSRWPLFVFLIGAICCLTFSAIYHLFFLHSDKVWKILAKLDYAGISILIATSCFPSYYYYFYCEEGKKLINKIY